MAVLQWCGNTSSRLSSLAWAAELATTALCPWQYVLGLLGRADHKSRQTVLLAQMQNNQRQLRRASCARQCGHDMLELHRLIS